MSVIQKIREKYAKWAVVAIALALVGFILTDYLSTQGKTSGAGETVLGKINGVEVDFISFETKVKAQEEQMAAQGQEVGEAGRQRILEGIWDQEIGQVIMNEEFDKLSLEIGKKEINDILFGANPPQDLKQRFSNEQGKYDAASAQSAINQMKKSTKKGEKEQLNNYIISLEQNRKMEKYNALLTNSIYQPKWRIEKQNTENSLVAKVSYVSYPYAKIADSTIKISDEEINDYVEKNKDQYKQEENRSIAYVMFNAAPTTADSGAIINQLSALKNEFLVSSDVTSFMARYGSAQQFYDGYNGRSQILVPNKDNILGLATNDVYGPYLDQASFVLAKMIDSKNLPDSVKARHILIQTTNPQQGQKLLEDSTAKKRIDSIALAIKGGASFNELAIKFSDDKGSGVVGGLLSNPQNPQTNYFNIGQMVKEFNDFCFEGKAGEKQIVKTAFGYHLVEILDQKNFQPHFKIAYFSKQIVASDETHRLASNAASRFASDSRNQKTFEENFEKTLKPQGAQKFFSTNIKPNDYLVEGVNAYGASRQLVREIYKAKKGDVLQPQLIGNKYIVAIVTETYDKGTQEAAMARVGVEPVLRNKKKAEQIIKNAGLLSGIEAAATKFEDSIKIVEEIKFSGNSALGFEPKVVGAIFNTQNSGKFIGEAIIGVAGVYVVSINSVSTIPNAVANIEEQRFVYQQQAKQMAGYYNQPIQILKKKAKIVDNRKNFY
ncbi:MAG: peptidylprolyl isomerase [Chitinophagaceae bacterium]|nr:MAG: peptidylprolyl isomerase [Chitinophagaceae bacterium]